MSVLIFPASNVEKRKGLEIIILPYKYADFYIFISVFTVFSLPIYKNRGDFPDKGSDHSIEVW